MKKFLTIILSAIILTACNSTISDKTSTDGKNEVNVAAVKTIELRVTGMTCEGCENTVKEAVNKVEGVTSTEASYTQELTKISYDSTMTSPEQLTTVINDLGYKVEGLAVNNNPGK
jgi:copper chaperone CopZ